MHRRQQARQAPHAVITSGKPKAMIAPSPMAEGAIMGEQCQREVLPEAFDDEAEELDAFFAATLTFR